MSQYNSDMLTYILDIDLTFNCTKSQHWERTLHLMLNYKMKNRPRLSWTRFLYQFIEAQSQDSRISSNVELS